MAMEDGAAGYRVDHRVSNGEYSIRVYAFDAKGNVGSISEMPAIRIERQGQQQTPNPVPVTERNEKAATTLTFPGPATIQNITSESGHIDSKSGSQLFY
jgi:hypothetical protein